MRALRQLRDALPTGGVAGRGKLVERGGVSEQVRTGRSEAEAVLHGERGLRRIQGVEEGIRLRKDAFCSVEVHLVVGVAALRG